MTKHGAIISQWLTEYYCKNELENLPDTELEFKRYALEQLGADMYCQIQELFKNQR